MSIVLEIGNEVIKLEGQEAESVIEQVTSQVYEKIVSSYAGHVLVELKERVKLDEMSSRCAGYHIYEAGKRGQAPTYTIEQLCWSVLLRHVESWSYRKTDIELRTNVLMRWFAGYGLVEETASSSTLRRFEEYVKENEPRYYFDEIVRIVDEAFPEEREKKQYGDTFAMHSRTEKQSRTAMMRDAGRRLLKNLKAVSPSVAEQVCKKEEKEELFGAEDEAQESRWPVEKRKSRELRTGLAAYFFLKRLDSALSQVPNQRDVKFLVVEQWRKILTKIVEDEFEFIADEKGMLAAKLREKNVKGRYRYGSVIDLDATFRNHGKSIILGYNINIATTDNFVREISAVTGATPDGVGVASLIREQKNHLGIVPPKIIYDQAAGYPTYFSQVHNASDGQTQLVARLVAPSKGGDRFGPRDFIQGEFGELICPGGHDSVSAFRDLKKGGYTYRFTPAICRECPLAQRCRGDAVKANQPRQVFVSQHTLMRREALAYTRTEEFEAEMKERSHVERIIAGVARYNDARHARSYGVANAGFQAKMSGMAYNAKRFVKLLTENGKAKTRNRGSPHEF